MLLNLKILNLEKFKIFFKNFLKNKKNIKLNLLKEGCYNNKYIFFYTKKIKKFNLVIKDKKKIIIINNINYINFKNIIIRYKKNFKIKNKIVRNLCNCNFSFNI